MRRILSVIMVGTFLAGCAGGGGTYKPQTFGINGEGASRSFSGYREISPGLARMDHNWKRDPDRLDWNKQGGEVLVSPTAQKMATVIRAGAKSFEVDLTDFNNYSRIKKGDIVQLNEGRYNTLPSDNLDGVTFRGVPGKTSVGRLDPYNPKAWATLQTFATKGNFFWDIFFAPIKVIPQGGRAYFFGCRFENVWADDYFERPDRMPGFVIGFSHLGHRQLRGAPGDEDKAIEVTYGMKLLLFDSLIHRSIGERYFTWVMTGEEFRRGAKSMELSKTLGELHLRDYAATQPHVNQKLAGLIASSRDVAISEVTAYEKTLTSKYVQKPKEMVKDFYGEATRYLSYRTEFKPQLDQPAINNIMARAQKEMKETNFLVAYAMMRRAAQKFGASEHLPARATTAEAEKGVGERYACDVEGSGTNTLRHWAIDNLPILNVAVPNSSCKISITKLGEPERSTESVTSQSNEIRYEEYDPMIRYKEMMRAAAQKEQEKAFAAGMNASVERMKDTARKMYEGRVRREGDYLVYGQGNFGGNASAGTLSAQRTAEQNAQAYQQAANAANSRGMAIKEVNVKHQTYYINYTYSYGVFATIKKTGEPFRKLDPGIRVAQWSRGPCQRNDANNFEQGKMTMNCAQNGPINGIPYGGNMVSSYENTIVLPFFTGFVAESIIPNVVKKIAQSKHSKDAGTRLESLLLTHYTNLGAVDRAEVSKLAQEVVGEPLTLEDFTDHLGIN